MKFNIEDYKGKYAMHCKTEEEAKDFCAYLGGIGRKWCDGGSYDRTNYQRYEKTRLIILMKVRTVMLHIIVIWATQF